MGQKVIPTSLRLGITEAWRSRWYAGKKEFGKLLVEDRTARAHIKKNYGFAGIAKVEIERKGNEVSVLISAAKPGLLIGRKGAEVDKLKSDLEDVLGRAAKIEIKEVSKPELSAQLVAESIAEQLSKRASFKRTMKKALDMTIEAGAKGAKVRVAGRLGGSEMARREQASLGSIPLHTLQADVDYGFTEASTPYGNIGIKVWVYKGILTPGKETTDGPDAKTSQVPQVHAGSSQGPGQ